MKSNSEFRKTARERLHGNWTNPVVISLILMAIIFVFSVASPRIHPGTYWQAFINSRTCFELIIGILLIYPLEYSSESWFLHFCREGKTPTVGELFTYFGNNYGRAVYTPFLVGIFTFLWTLLLIIPGFIMGIAYSQSYYIAIDHPEMSPLDCIKRSRALMKGHKWQYFCLLLSFIGWGILCCITLGIGFLWLCPYMQTSTVEFYRDLIAEQEPAPAAEN